LQLKTASSIKAEQKRHAEGNSEMETKGYGKDIKGRAGSVGKSINY
jgi:hypothetical protein